MWFVNKRQIYFITHWNFQIFASKQIFIMLSTIPQTSGRFLILQIRLKKSKILNVGLEMSHYTNSYQCHPSSKLTSNIMKILLIIMISEEDEWKECSHLLKVKKDLKTDNLFIDVKLSTQKSAEFVFCQLK